MSTPDNEYLGYVETKTQKHTETEMVLRKKLPEHYWIPVNSLLVAFGQGTCWLVGPHCDMCVLLRNGVKWGQVFGDGLFILKDSLHIE